MAALKLEVGKTYKTSTGRNVTIDKLSSKSNTRPGWPFRSSELGLYYTPRGKASHSINDRCMDLIEEVIDSDTELILKVGVFYISRHGKSLKIVEKLGSFFRAEGNTFYTREGKVCIPDRREEESWDIIPKGHPGPFWTSPDHKSGS